jgi:glutathione S-transferase
MNVYGLRMSPFVRKVLCVLEIKGLAYEQINTTPQDTSAEFLAMSPLGKIPAFDDGALKISDSTVICEYLDEQYPAVPTLPKSTIDRARARWLEEYADTKLVELCGGGIFFERVVKPMFLKQPTDEAKVEMTINTLLPPVLDYLESQAPTTGFLFGTCGRVDISLANPLINAEYAQYQIDAIKWPKLAAFITRVKAVPAMAKLLKIEAEAMSR